MRANFNVHIQMRVTRGCSSRSNAVAKEDACIGVRDHHLGTCAAQSRASTTTSCSGKAPGKVEEKQLARKMQKVHLDIDIASDIGFYQVVLKLMHVASNNFGCSSCLETNGKDDIAYPSSLCRRRLVHSPEMTFIELH